MGLLLDFNVKVDEKSAYLLPRSEHSRIKAGLIKHMASEISVTLQPETLSLLTAIYEFGPGAWGRFLKRSQRRFSGRFDPDKSLLEYLDAYFDDFMGWNVSPEMIKDWLCESDSVTRLVRQYAPSSISSAAEHPLLALPQYPEVISNTAEVRNLLEKLRKFLEAVDAEAENGNERADRLLWQYAQYGQHWDALAGCVVPLDEPFLIKLSEKRELQLKDPSKDRFESGKPLVAIPSKAHQLVVFGDAASNHVNVSVGDPNVELKNDWRLETEHREAVWDVQEEKSSAELLAFYDSRDDRSYRLWLKLPLKPTGPGWVSRMVVAILTITALAAFASFSFHWFGAGGTESMAGSDVAVVLIPSAIAAALLLVRESSTLSAEINKEFHYVTSAVLAILWILTLILYGINRVDWGN
ncbi:hypothetical protein [Streptomyces sp. bgisy034]|uniref:hypothetical protein n=1 Tax=Streptomyces sp. bgisy034 TaxID=3413774 RepID=UPI003EB95126